MSSKQLFVATKNHLFFTVQYDSEQFTSVAHFYVNNFVKFGLARGSSPLQYIVNKIRVYVSIWDFFLEQVIASKKGIIKRNTILK